MLHFENDYNTGCLPEILQALSQSNEEALAAYGEDSYSLRAKEKIAHACGTDAQVVLLSGGTQTNAVVISTLLEDYQGVIAAETAHIALHEAGAIEYTGNKVITLPQHEGKIDADALRRYLVDFYADDNREHMVFPGMVYISDSTEYGTVYTKAELQALREICDTYRLLLYLDGARLGYALAADGADVRLKDIAALCDVFYIGGTKLGALCGEAVVFGKAEMPPHFLNRVKKRGALLAKGRLTGVQFDTLFSDDLYFKTAARANALAKELETVFLQNGYEQYLETTTNQKFFVLTNAQHCKLKEKLAYSFWERIDPEHIVVRLASTWSTTEEDISALDAVLKAEC